MVSGQKHNRILDMNKRDIILEKRLQNIVDNSVRLVNENYEQEGSWPIWDYIKGAFGAMPEGGRTGALIGRLEDAVGLCNTLLTQYQTVLDGQYDAIDLKRAGALFRQLIPRVKDVDKYKLARYEQGRGAR